MIVALLLAAFSMPSAIDAERAFAADAQRLGQWTAFRKYADRDAVMFTPQAVWARDFLKGRQNTPKAGRWWPARNARTSFHRERSITSFAVPKAFRAISTIFATTRC